MEPHTTLEESHSKGNADLPNRRTSPNAAVATTILIPLAANLMVPLPLPSHPHWTLGIYIELLLDGIADALLSPNESLKKRKKKEKMRGKTTTIRIIVFHFKKAA